MTAILKAVHKRIALDNGILPSGERVPFEYICDTLTAQAAKEIWEAAIVNPDSAWEIFKFGTENEFATLVNQLGCIGVLFETDEAKREIMRLAKKRGTQLVLEETKMGFGKSFDRFWNETGP